MTAPTTAPVSPKASDSRRVSWLIAVSSCSVPCSWTCKDEPGRAPMVPSTASSTRLIRSRAFCRS